MVEHAIELLEENWKVLDLCTGSGCIAVSIAHFGQQKNVQVTAIDVSKSALLVAKENAIQNQVQVEWLRSDLFDRISGKYQMIVSNPPYIPTKVLEGLQPEVRDFEPHLALDGQDDGYYFYREIAKEAGAYLVDGGYLLLEIGHDQAVVVSGLLKESGFIDIEVKKDLTGFDRLIHCRKKAVEEEESKS